jgi:hypothetical protein
MGNGRKRDRQTDRQEDREREKTKKEETSFQKWVKGDRLCVLLCEYVRVSIHEFRGMGGGGGGLKITLPPP